MTGQMYCIHDIDISASVCLDCRRGQEAEFRRPLRRVEDAPLPAGGVPAWPGPLPGRPDLGPWFIAAYRGSCAGCGEDIEPDDEIRSDGRGGWQGRCCGD